MQAIVNLRGKGIKRKVSTVTMEGADFCYTREH